MRGVVAAIAVAAWASLAAAETAPVEIPFSPSANSGWQITETRTRVARGEGQDSTRTATTRGTLTINAASQHGFGASWIVDQIDAAGMVVTNEPELLVGLTMRVTLDEAGAPTAVEDWPGLRQRIMRAVEELTPAAERTQEWRRGVTAMDGLMAQWGAGHAAQLLVPSVAVMSICQGTGLIIGEPVSAVSQLPNALGGPPIDATETLTLTSVDRTAGVARLTYLRQLDPESATIAIRESLINLARQSGRPVAEIEQTFANMSLTHDTRAECVVDLRTGVTRSVTHEVVVSMGPAYRSDRREISVVAR